MIEGSDHNEHLVAMRDGHELLTRVWHPQGEPPFDTILEEATRTAGRPTRNGSQKPGMPTSDSRAAETSKAACFAWTMSTGTTASTG